MTIVSRRCSCGEWPDRRISRSYSWILVPRNARRGGIADSPPNKSAKQSIPPLPTRKRCAYVKLSLSFWNGRLGRMIGRWGDPFDAKEAARLCAQITEVIAQIRELGLVDAQLENQIHRAEVRVALLTEDAGTLSSCSDGRPSLMIKLEETPPAVP